MEQKPIYDPPLEAAPHRPESPGVYPFTRGIYRNMYRGRIWTMRQYAGFGTAEGSNLRYRQLLELGQTGLSVAFDLPTQMGLDPDNLLAEGEVGKVGVSVCSLRDMEILLRDIPLDKVSLSMTINSTAAILLGMVLCVARGRGTEWSALRGTIQNDILKEYIARGTYIYPPVSSMRLVIDTMIFCREHVPAWNPISVSGYHIREAGCTAVQEVAFTLAAGIEYVEHALKAGMEIDEVTGRLSFFFNAHNNFLEEIAKFRAARRLWARMVNERFGSSNPRSCALRFHAQTAGSALTASQPENNIIRVTLQALAAVLGGAQSLHTNSLDEALALPSEFAATLALRTQQVIACESGVVNTVDPTGGAYAIETMTDEIEAEAELYLRKIEQIGGMMRAIETSYVQREIQEAAYRYQRSVEKGESVIVGVNRFVGDEATHIDLLVIDDTIAESRRKDLFELRQSRDSDAVAGALNRLGESARSGRNVMPFILDAVQSLATVGEISDCMRQAFGEYRESPVI